jgi:hypothetical protein
MIARAAGLIAALLATSGCGDGAAAPSGRELVGMWGSSEVQLIALYAGAELRIPCTRFIIDDAILLNDDNGFSAMARVDGPGLTTGTLPVVRLTGSVAGDEVTIALPASPATTAATYILVNGVAPAPEDEVPCPA